MKLAPKYVTNDSGEKTDIILPIADFEMLLEDLSDLAAIADRRSEPTVSHNQFIAELKADGILLD